MRSVLAEYQLRLQLGPGLAADDAVDDPGWQQMMPWMPKGHHMRLASRGRPQEHHSTQHAPPGHQAKQRQTGSAAAWSSALGASRRSRPQRQGGPVAKLYATGSA